MEFLGILIGIVGVIAVVFGLIALVSVIKGFVIAKIWLWFMVPIFGLPVLSIAQAIGVALVIGIFTNEHASLTQQDDPKKKKNAILTGLLAPFMTLLFGWIVKMFI